MGHFRQVLVAKDVNYGASKSNAAANTALNPEDLAAGALGIYGIGSSSSANNAGKLALIVDGGADAAGKIPAASFDGDHFFIAVGKADGSINSNSYDLQSFRYIKGAAYSAPQKGVRVVGYDGSAGLLNYPETVNKGDEAMLTVISRGEGAGNQVFDRQTISYSASAGESAYSVLKGLISNIEARQATGGLKISTPSIVSNGSGTAFTTAATVAVVKGETSFTTSAAHGVDVGDYVILDGILYQAVAGTTGTTLVIDRPYEGPSGTIANGDTADVGTTVPTQLGLQVTDANFNDTVELAVDGLLVDSDVVVSTNPSPGSGSAEHVKREELDARPYQGSHDRIHSYAPMPALTVDESQTYDMYFLELQNRDQSKGDQGSVFKIINYLTVAVPSEVADTTGKNQSDFEDILSQFTSLMPTLF